MPNGLQWFEGELFVMDQLTDDIFVLNDYGNILRVINTQTENGSGITVGGGYVWMLQTDKPEPDPSREHDDHSSKILKIDYITGETIDFPPNFAGFRYSWY